MKIQINRRSLIVGIVSGALFIFLIGLVLFGCFRSKTHQWSQSYCKCKGIDNQIKSRIINGTFVPKGSLPWVANIFAKFKKFASVQGLCFACVLNENVQLI